MNTRIVTTALGLLSLAASVVGLNVIAANLPTYVKP
jgi:hypothetical protein